MVREIVNFGVVYSYFILWLNYGIRDTVFSSFLGDGTQLTFRSCHVIFESWF